MSVIRERLYARSVYSFILWSVGRQVHSLFQRGFSTHCDLLLPLSIHSILPFPWGYPVASSSLSSPHFYRSLYLFLSNLFQMAVPKPDVTKPVSLSSCLRLTPCLPVISVVPSIFSSITCFRRQFLSQMWQNQLASVAAYVLLLVFPSFSIVPSYLCLNNVFYYAVPTPDVINPLSLPTFYVSMIFLSSLTLLTLLRFSHHRPNWSSPSFSSTTLRNFPGNSDLLRE